MLMQTRILRLNKAGIPLQWLTREEAATLLVKGQVLWSLGDTAIKIRGGINRLGNRSELVLPPIIATDGDIKHNDHHVPAVSNRLLFRRDCNLCLYCGDRFPAEMLTRGQRILDQSGNRLPPLQSTQGRQHTGRGEHASAGGSLQTQQNGISGAGQPQYPGGPDGLPAGRVFEKYAFELIRQSQRQGGKDQQLED